MLPTTHKREIKQNSNTVEEKKTHTHTIKCVDKKKKNLGANKTMTTKMT